MATTIIECRHHRKPQTSKLLTLSLHSNIAILRALQMNQSSSDRRTTIASYSPDAVAALRLAGSLAHCDAGLTHIHLACEFIALLEQALACQGSGSTSGSGGHGCSWGIRAESGVGVWRWTEEVCDELESYGTPGRRRPILQIPRYTHQVLDSGWEMRLGRRFGRPIGAWRNGVHRALVG